MTKPTEDEMDFDSLVRAIQEGTQTSAPTAADVGRSTLALFLVGALLAVVLTQVLPRRPSVRVSLDGTWSGSFSVNLTNPGGHVRWELGSVQARTMELAGPAYPQDSLVVPVKQSACRFIQARLGVTCHGNVLVFPYLIEAVWDSPQELYMEGTAASGDRSSRLDLQVQMTGADTTGLGPAPIVNVVPTGGPSIRFSTGLTIGTGGLTLENVNRVARLPASDLNFSPTEGALVLRTQDQPGGSVPEASFGGVAGLQVNAWSSDVNAEGLSGQLHLGAGTPIALDPLAGLTLDAKTNGTVNVQMTMGPGGADLQLRSTALAAAFNGGADLVTTIWERDNDWILALVSLLLPPSLNLVVAFSRRRPRRHERREPKPLEQEGAGDQAAPRPA